MKSAFITIERRISNYKDDIKEKIIDAQDKICDNRSVADVIVSIDMLSISIDEKFILLLAIKPYDKFTEPKYYN